MITTEFEFAVIHPGDECAAFCQELKIVFMLRGNGWLHTEADPVYALSPEDLFVINSFQIHHIILEENALAIMLVLSPSFLAASSPENSQPGIHCKSFLCSDEEQQPYDLLRRDFALAFRAWYKKESELSIHLRSRIMVLTDDLFQNFSGPKQDRGAESGRAKLLAAVDYIHKNYRENITLTDLSAQTYLSPSYISRSFQKYFGISFTGYLMQVRLFHTAALLHGEQTITELAYESGFSSSSALIEAFKQYYGVTPGQYRRNITQHKDSQASPGIPAKEEFSTTFISLMKYATEKTATVPPAVSIHEINTDIRQVKRQLKHTWKMVINSGYARDLLNASMQNQILRLQKSVGFQYIRCKGILDDDMVLYSRDIYGEISVNYVYLNQVLDFILSVGAKPMLEFGHMPSAMAKRKVQTFKRPVFLSPPGDLEQWNLLISGLMEHLALRYGVAEMREWLFVPWISLDLHFMGFFTLEEYTGIYTTSYRSIKRVCSDFKICGPGCTAISSQARKWYFDMCREYDCMPDIFTARSYAAINPDDEKNGLKLDKSNETFHMAVSGDEEYLAHSLKEMKRFLEEEGIPNLPIMLDEWSNNIWQRDLCNDTCYKSAYLFKSIMENHDSYYGLGYYNVSDQLDEIAPAPEIFHGGFGLFTQNGIPKSAYRAMQLLNKAGDSLIAKGDGYWITRTKTELQIFLHNYCHYDMLYRYRNTTNLTKTQRYKVFLEKPQQSYHIRLEGFPPGTHIVRRYSISQKGGSTYDAWLDLGAPERMTKEEEKYLQKLSYPVYKTETITTTKSEGQLTIKTSLFPHEVQLITISISG